MARIWCATVECVNNKNNRCTAAEINLSDGHIHTVHQGFKQVWYCRTYNMSKESKQIEDQIKEWLQQPAKEGRMTYRALEREIEADNAKC